VSALFRHGDGWAVFVAAENRARLKPVTLGPRNGVVAVVLDGVAPGAPVIAYPSDAIADGVRVKVRTESKAT
jgi:HlyD family secretion protein